MLALGVWTSESSTEVLHTAIYGTINKEGDNEDITSEAPLDNRQPSVISA